MFLPKLVFAPGPGEVEWSWTHANKCFCSLGQSCLLAPALHSYTACYCFPFIASCHSLCQSLIRTTSFRRLISHFSNFLTLHNEREGLKGIDWKEGETHREKVRKGIRCACVYLIYLSVFVRTNLSLSTVLENERIKDNAWFWTALVHIIVVRFGLGWWRGWGQGISLSWSRLR